MTIQELEALQRLVTRFQSKADAECLERGPGWVGAEAAYRADADELDELLVSMAQDGWIPA